MKWACCEISVWMLDVIDGVVELAFGSCRSVRGGQGDKLLSRQLKTTESKTITFNKIFPYGSENRNREFEKRIIHEKIS